jgi:trans-aconitate methyltransferase
VWQQDFLKLDLPEERFDGIFANAALFHVPSHELPRVLRQLHGALKPQGRPVQLQSARRERGRLEPRPLRRLPQS